MIICDFENAIMIKVIFVLNKMNTHYIYTSMYISASENIFKFICDTNNFGFNYVTII